MKFTHDIKFSKIKKQNLQKQKHKSVETIKEDSEMDSESTGR